MSLKAYKAEPQPWTDSTADVADPLLSLSDRIGYSVGASKPSSDVNSF